ncbi:MAG: thiamine diphosphokinase [Actinomycetia bacterium]|nr:thiamine diphosphokinase [Actinomycetes bacterium]
MEQPAPIPTRSLLFAGGNISDIAAIPDHDIVIAADSGYDLARQKGIDVDVLIGDLDSISAEGLTHAETTGVHIHRFDIDKDATDFELALVAAQDLGVTSVDIYGGEGGSLGHFIGITTGITAQRWRHLAIEWHMGTRSLYPVHPKQPLRLDAPQGSSLTIIPIGDTRGVSATGVRWPLVDEQLPRGTSRGLSNVVVETTQTICLDQGTLLVIVEGQDPQ